MFGSNCFADSKLEKAIANIKEVNELSLTVIREIGF